jgi:hypothetical protein
MSPSRRFGATAILALLLAVAPGFLRADPLEDARARLKIEAERIEREFSSTRSTAYSLVRRSTPRLAEALENIDALLAILADDRSLSAERRSQLIRTLKSDQAELRRIAEDRRRASSSSGGTPYISPRPTPPSSSGSSGKARVDETKARMDRIKGILADGKIRRLDGDEGRTRTWSELEKSAKPISDEYTFPRNWKELSERRSGAIKMTETEKRIITGLDKTYEVDFDRSSYQDVIDYLRKVTGLPITVDTRALEEAGQKYDTPVTLKNKLSLRSILKKINAEMGMAYVIKDETIMITSQARANAMTVTRAYYLGDLVAVAGMNFDPITNQLAIQARVNTIISTILQNVDRQSWKANNPDAVGAITFDPLTMSLIVKQTAEFHFKNFGAFR